MDNQNSLTTLGLQLPTDPRWVHMAEISLEAILTDHAYCEQKAAIACISLISQYPEYFEMVKSLAPIVTEEWGHFRLVLQELEKRGLKLGFQRKDEYVNSLLQFQKKSGLSRAERLMEKLLTCALIEARSCERFRLLSLHINEIELREFYRKFMVAEAGHYRLFIDLAKSVMDETVVRKRWKEYLAYEEDLMKELEVRGDRMH
jgi:tRNA 2-(methylsulfanyl)-N6-isopentenyladenosine37 hydroxylase